MTSSLCIIRRLLWTGHFQVYQRGLGEIPDVPGKGLVAMRPTRQPTADTGRHEPDDWRVETFIVLDQRDWAQRAFLAMFLRIVRSRCLMKMSNRSSRAPGAVRSWPFFTTAM